MSFKLVMLPPQTQVFRDWGKALQEEFSDLEVVIAETYDQAAAAIVDACHPFNDETAVHLHM